MSVVISDEILQASQLTPSEFCQEIALFLNLIVAVKPLMDALDRYIRV